MKSKISVFILGLILTVLIPWRALAVPLALEENIKALSAERSGSAEGFDFMVLGDNRGNERFYKRLLDQVKTFSPLFIIHTGDLVTSGQAFEYEDYQKWIADFPIPILHVPGNHDVGHDSTNYRRFVGENNWFLDLGPWHVVGLDNSEGKFSQETVALARKWLSREKVCLVAFHKPPAVGRWKVHAMHDDQKGGRGGELMDLIETAAVPMVFLGHIHLYDAMVINEVQYVISGGGGAPLYDHYGFGKAEYGFVLVQVRPEGVSQRWVPLQ
jgi:3',5'-cyclic AMP phosphodiesterase CpdA